MPLKREDYIGKSYCHLFTAEAGQPMVNISLPLSLETGLRIVVTQVFWGGDSTFSVPSKSTNPSSTTGASHILPENMINSAGAKWLTMSCIHSQPLTDLQLLFHKSPAAQEGAALDIQILHWQNRSAWLLQLALPPKLAPWKPCVIPHARFIWDLSLIHYWSIALFAWADSTDNVPPGKVGNVILKFSSWHVHFGKRGRRE